MHREELSEIVEMLWSAYFGESVRRMDVVPDELRLSPAIVGEVKFHGAFEGSLTVRCDEHMASRIAARMFGQSASETTREDLRDAIGEMANVVGGNAKALLPAPCSLSLPEVVNDLSDTTDDGASDEDVGFRVHGSEGWMVLRLAAVA